MATAKVVHAEPYPPPIEKVMMELTEHEARALAYWCYSVFPAGGKHGSAAITIGKALDSAGVTRYCQNEDCYGQE
jgi:hypothetical protein